MIYKVDFEGQACKQIKEKAESYQYDLKSVLKGIGLLIADMWLPGDSKPQINTWEGLFEKVQEDYSYKDCKFRFIGSPIPLATDQCFRS